MVWLQRLELARKSVFLSVCINYLHTDNLVGGFSGKTKFYFSVGKIWTSFRICKFTISRISVNYCGLTTRVFLIPFRYEFTSPSVNLINCYITDAQNRTTFKFRIDITGIQLKTGAFQMQRNNSTHLARKNSYLCGQKPLCRPPPWCSINFVQNTKITL